jgi:hypothetical protein
MRISYTGMGLSFLAFLFLASVMHAMEEDGYPIENYRLDKFYGITGSEDCAAGDLAWFVDESGDQALVIGLHVDYHKIRFLHFNPENIPDVVLEFIDLHYRKPEHSGSWKLLAANEKRRCMEHFLDKAERIPSSYFVTIRGFALGMSAQEAEKHYGSPHSVETIPEGRILSWEFAGDPSLLGRRPNADQPYAENSFGYHIKILFEEDKAAAIVMASLSP